MIDRLDRFGARVLWALNRRLIRFADWLAGRPPR